MGRQAEHLMLAELQAALHVERAFRLTAEARAQELEAVVAHRRRTALPGARWPTRSRADVSHGKGPRDPSPHEPAHVARDLDPHPEPSPSSSATHASPDVMALQSAVIDALGRQLQNVERKVFCCTLERPGDARLASVLRELQRDPTRMLQAGAGGRPGTLPVSTLFKGLAALSSGLSPAASTPKYACPSPTPFHHPTAGDDDGWAPLSLSGHVAACSVSGSDSDEDAAAAGASSPSNRPACSPRFDSASDKEEAKEEDAAWLLQQRTAGEQAHADLARERAEWAAERGRLQQQVNDALTGAVLERVRQRADAAEQLRAERRAHAALRRLYDDAVVRFDALGELLQQELPSQVEALHRVSRLAAGAASALSAAELEAAEQQVHLLRDSPVGAAAAVAAAASAATATAATTAAEQRDSMVSSSSSEWSAAAALEDAAAGLVEAGRRREVQARHQALLQSLPGQLDALYQATRLAADAAGAVSAAEREEQQQRQQQQQQQQQQQLQQPAVPAPQVIAGAYAAARLAAFDRLLLQELPARLSALHVSSRAATEAARALAAAELQAQQLAQQHLQPQQQQLQQQLQLQPAAVTAPPPCAHCGGGGAGAAARLAALDGLLCQALPAHLDAAHSASRLAADIACAVYLAELEAQQPLPPLVHLPVAVPVHTSHELACSSQPHHSAACDSGAEAAAEQLQCPTSVSVSSGGEALPSAASAWPAPPRGSSTADAAAAAAAADSTVAAVAASASNARRPRTASTPPAALLRSCNSLGAASPLTAHRHSAAPSSGRNAQRTSIGGASAGGAAAPGERRTAVRSLSPPPSKGAGLRDPPPVKAPSVYTLQTPGVPARHTLARALSRRAAHSAESHLARELSGGGEGGFGASTGGAGSGGGGSGSGGGSGGGSGERDDDGGDEFEEAGSGEHLAGAVRTLQRFEPQVLVDLVSGLKNALEAAHLEISELSLQVDQLYGQHVLLAGNVVVKDKQLERLALEECDAVSSATRLRRAVRHEREGRLRLRRQCDELQARLAVLLGGSLMGGSLLGGGGGGALPAAKDGAAEGTSGSGSESAMKFSNMLAAAAAAVVIMAAQSASAAAAAGGGQGAGVAGGALSEESSGASGQGYYGWSSDLLALQAAGGPSEGLPAVASLQPLGSEDAGPCAKL